MNAFSFFASRVFPRLQQRHNNERLVLTKTHRPTGDLCGDTGNTSVKNPHRDSRGIGVEGNRCVVLITSGSYQLLSSSRFVMNFCAMVTVICISLLGQKAQAQSCGLWYRNGTTYGLSATGTTAAAVVNELNAQILSGWGAYNSQVPGDPNEIILTVDAGVVGGQFCVNQSGGSPPDNCSTITTPTAADCQPGYYVSAVVPAKAQVKSPDPIAEPINPALGNVYMTETDVQFGALAFQRFYNSADAVGIDGVPGWRHSYSRSVNKVYQAASSFYPGQTTVVSPQYSTQALACTSGFAAIQSSVSAWSAATATYSGSVCVIANGSTTISTLPIQVYPPPTPPAAAIEYDVIRDDGTTLRYPVMSNGTISNPPGVSIRLSVTGSGFSVTDDADNVETYNSSGVLQSIASRSGVVQTMSYSSGLWSGVSDSFGNFISVTRNSSGNIGLITINGGGTVQYSYDTSHRLSGVTNLDGTTRGYTYGNSVYSDALTQLVDESGVIFSNWNYDSFERATSTAQAVGANATSLVYNSNGSVSITDALGASRTFTYTRIGDMNQTTSISGSQCPSCQDSAATTYDSYGWVASRTDYNGNVTCYANDPTRGLELVRVEGFAPGSTCPSSLASYTPASGTLQRKISTAWNSTWREPALITEPNRTTGYTYDGYGNVLTKTITDTSVTPNASRTWTYTYYNSGLYGQVHTLTGPRTDITTDVTTYTYYNCSSGSQCGQIDTLTNAMGQVTTFNTYNAYGLPLTITDPNGVVTTLAYDARERLTSSEIGTETTSYTYWPINRLKLVTLPDSSTMQFTYDGAHRLTQITDGVGNYIHYTLDALGNHTADDSYDPSGTLHRAHTRVFNTLSQLYQDINSAGTSAVTTTYTYDSQGNQTAIDAPLSRNTGQGFDALNRLDKITDPNGGITQLGYDANDNLASVIDPRSLTTSYSHDGFNEVTQLVSPDTGTTVKTYDSAGNLKTSTDARGALGTYTYDALNRLTQIAYSDEVINYTYDAGTNGKGRLTGASDANHAMAWSYDTHGRVTGKAQTLGTLTKSVGYGYTNGDLTSIVTPSGQTITYGYTNHQITSISVNGTVLLNNVTYDPFGPVTGWSWGNGTTVSRHYDEDGNPSSFTTAADTLSYTVDSASRITTISDPSSTANSWSLGYDVLDRLNSAYDGSKYGFTYDANGNRLTQTSSGASTYTVSSTSNQVNSITGSLVRSYTYDAAGNIKTSGVSNFTYNQRGRLVTDVTGSTTGTHVYNALGQMIQNQFSTINTEIIYDEAGHVLGEYSPTNGALQSEKVWLGDIPVGHIVPNGSGISLYYLHTDHLNTVRKITRPSDNGLMWTWVSTPWGVGTPNSNPAGLGAFYIGLRLPGQYFTQSDALYQNGFRDYDPQTGRYVESDPLGLAGGSASTYSYANANPISNKDPLGLWGTAAHNVILTNAFPNLAPELQEALESGSASVDAVLNQGASTAYQHAMTAPGQSPSDAQSQMCAFVQKHLQTYQNLLAQSTNPAAQTAAYYALGQALHPIMDSTSPAHAGWQVWGNPWEPSWWGEWDAHGDSSTSIENLAHLTPTLLGETLNRIQQAMSGSGMCGCQK